MTFLTDNILQIIINYHILDNRLLYESIKQENYLNC